MARFRLSGTARVDLKAIYRQGEEQFGLKRADAYSAGLITAFNLIADYPLLSRLRDEIPSPVRVHPYRSQVIVYAIDTTGVLILRIRHPHEDWIDNPVGDPG
ncbi:type II toxin-antitoxin system RelE/ParE family toxin [Brevundimonas sp.]|uniref:type II toxin-antitoxin system RelE/ParE family toxin n=1 Tax=Brevundimonas sp. TaxID=1871086 RepID=UPI003A95282C